MAEIAEGLLVKVGTDLKALRQLKRDVDRAVKPVVDRIGRIGDAMTRTVTPAILGAGAASIKLASDFESSMTRINTLVGVAQDQVDDWGKDILRLAPRLGRAPRELSEALFVVTSAGQRGAAAMDIVEQSAKAAAIGLGETRDIARATTAAMTAYGKETLDAAQATDIMTAIVREGNLEAAELAPSIGRVLGLASDLGVSFQELGANIATFTRLGVGAREAVTALRGVMNTVLKPTTDAKKAAAELGFSLDSVRRMIEDEGLAAALQFMVDKTEGNDEALSMLIPDVRALSNVLGTAGAQGDTYAEVLANISDATGIVDEGFEKVSETAEQKFNQALASLKTSGIEIGNTMLPIMSNLAERTSVAAEAFGALDDNLQELLVTMGLVAAAAGPVMKGIRLIGGAASIAVGSIVALAVVLGNISRQSKILAEEGPTDIGRGLRLGSLVDEYENAEQAALDAARANRVFKTSLEEAGFDTSGLLGPQATVMGLLGRVGGAGPSPDSSSSGGGGGGGAVSIDPRISELANRGPQMIGFVREKVFELNQETGLFEASWRMVNDAIEVSADQLRQTVAPAVSFVAEEARVLQATLGATGLIIAEDLANIGARAVGDLVSGFQSLEEVIFNVGRAVKALVSDIIAAVVRAGALKAIGAAFGLTSGATTFSSLFLQGIGFGGARAHGGGVSPRMAYRVGERGPETFVPNTAGRIVPNGGGNRMNVNLSPAVRISFDDMLFGLEQAANSQGKTLFS